MQPVAPDQTREIDYGIRDIETEEMLHVLDRWEAVQVPLRFGSRIEAAAYAHYLHGRAWSEMLEVIPIDDAVEPSMLTQSAGDMNA